MRGQRLRRSPRPLVDPAWPVDQQQCFVAGRQAGAASSSSGNLRLPLETHTGGESPKLMPRSRAVRIESQSSGTDFIRRVASASGT